MAQQLAPTFLLPKHITLLASIYIFRNNDLDGSRVSVETHSTFPGPISHLSLGSLSLTGEPKPWRYHGKPTYSRRPA